MHLQLVAVNTPLVPGDANGYRLHRKDCRHVGRHHKGLLQRGHVASKPHDQQEAHASFLCVNGGLVSRLP